MRDDVSTSTGSIARRYDFGATAETISCIDAIDEMEEIDAETSWQEFYTEIDAWAARAMPAQGFGEL